MAEPDASGSSSSVDVPRHSSVAEESILLASTSDQPSSKDQLGFLPYAEAIAEFLLSEDTRPPLTLSIEGEWGCGKSSFMLQLEQALRERTPDLWQWLRDLPHEVASAVRAPRPDQGLKGGRRDRASHSTAGRLRGVMTPPVCLTVRFNAWRHDREEALWAAFALWFLRSVRRQRARPRRWWGNLRLFSSRYRWGSGWFELARAAGLWSFALLAVAAGTIALYQQGPDWVLALQDGNSTFLGWIVGLGGVSAYVAAAAALLLKIKGFAGNPLEVDLRRYLKSPDYEGRVAFVEQFHSDFRHIVDAYAGGRKVFVFIDDLDRCDVPKAADLMKALNLLISDDPRLVFIVGLDREKVAAGLAVKYEKLLPYLPRPVSTPPRAGSSDAREDAKAAEPTDLDLRGQGLAYGYEFVEKFIQLPFRVPAPTVEELEGFLEALALGADHAAPAPDARVTEAERSEGRRQRLVLQLGADSEAVRRGALMVSGALEHNPRRLKQFVNLFRLRAYIARETGLFDEIGDSRGLTLELLAKFVAIELVWPGLLAGMDESPDLLSRLETAVLTDDRSDLGVRERRWADIPRLADLLSFGLDADARPRSPNSFEGVDLSGLLRVAPRVKRLPSADPLSGGSVREPLPAEDEEREPVSDHSARPNSDASESVAKETASGSGAPRRKAARRPLDPRKQPQSSEEGTESLRSPRPPHSQA